MKDREQIKVLQIGSAVGQPGELSCGWFDIAQLPTGEVERLPVLICQGHEPGPVFWITAGIHGNELTGVSAIHETITRELAKSLHGSVVAISMLNPEGVLTGQRMMDYSYGDPNRAFPGYRREGEAETPIKSIYESAMERLFAVIHDSADYLIDLHCYGLQSTPFILLDRVLHHDEKDKARAQELLCYTDELAAAFGVPVVNEGFKNNYFEQGLHRTVSGATLNTARIPAFTVELGMQSSVEPAALAAGTTGIRNALKWVGMLDGEIEPVKVPQPTLGFDVKRAATPTAKASGLIRYHVRPGDTVRRGDLIASLRDVFGQPLPGDQAEIRAEEDGWVISLQLGLICYQGQAVCNMGVCDEEPMIIPVK